jgi:aromatic-L-amino-acid decarboxylase
MGILTFRYAPPSLTPEERNRRNQALVDQIIASGFAMVSSTELRGRSVLRMCTINPRTTADDVRETLRRLDEMAKGQH